MVAGALIKRMVAKRTLLLINNRSRDTDRIEKSSGALTQKYNIAATLNSSWPENLRRCRRRRKRERTASESRSLAWELQNAAKYRIPLDLSFFCSIYPLTTLCLLCSSCVSLQSCLIKRYCEKRFVSKYMSTLGIDFGVTKLVNTSHYMQYTLVVLWC